MNKNYLLVVKADMNDADYVENTYKVTQEELDEIMPVINAIRDFKPYQTRAKGNTWTHEHNYPTGEHNNHIGEMSAEELYGHIEGFKKFHNDYVPKGDPEYGIHTIQSIKLYTIAEEKELILQT